MFCFLASGSEICLISLTIVTLQAMATDRPTNRANIPLPLHLHFLVGFFSKVCFHMLPLPLLLQAIIKKVIQ